MQRHISPELQVEVSAISIEVINARTAEEKELCYRIRYDVFVKETGYIQRENDNGFEKDEYDELDTTFHFLAYFNGIPAGSARLLLPNKSVCERKTTYYGLPMESLYDLNYYTSTDLQIAEISRSCVKEKFKSTKTIFFLWKKLIESASKGGITDLITNVNPETDSLSDTYTIYKYARSSNLFDSDIVVYPKKSGGKTTGFRFPLMQKASGDMEECQARNIILPQTLKLFVRVGLLFTGEPIYCDGIDMCALPMNWKIKDISKTSFGKFFSNKETGATGEVAA